MKLPSYKLGASEIVILAAFVVLAVWGMIQRARVNENSLYTKGVISGKRKGSKGSTYLDFTFYFRNQKVVNWAPLSSCKGCNVGDSVIVKFNSLNPNINKLLKKLPTGASLTYPEE